MNDVDMIISLSEEIINVCWKEGEMPAELVELRDQLAKKVKDTLFAHSWCAIPAENRW